MLLTLTGRTLGNYQIVERLGQGQHSSVYKARQINLNRLVSRPCSNNLSWIVGQAIQKAQHR